MHWRRLSGVVVGSVVLVLGLAACSQSTTGVLGAQGLPVAKGNPLGVHPAGPNNAPVCPGPVAQGTAGCTSRVIVDKGGSPLASSAPKGYAPSQIRGYYGFDSVTQDGTGRTIAIVDAYDDPNIVSDLGVFKNEFGFGTQQCTFSKVDQTGGTKYPKKDAGWSLEISLDVEWACAIAPGANILLVEADSNSFANLLTAVAYAAQHADVVSMSWGGSESSSDPSSNATFDPSPNSQHPSVIYTASSGDSGAGVIYPAASPNVVAVGGTTLPLSGSALSGTVTAWSGSGGGVSAYEAEPGYQQTLQATSLGGKLVTYANGMRGVPDVSYDADPSTGFSVYDTVRYQGQSGWYVVGGTSAGAPQWAALFALADQAGSTVQKSVSGSPVYDAAMAGYSSNFDDVQTGNDCASSGPSHGPFGGGGGGGSSDICTAGPAYDLVTGLGSPKADVLVGALAGY